MMRLGWVATSSLFSRAILLCMGLFSRFCVWPLQSVRICCSGAYGESIQLQPITPFNSHPENELLRPLLAGAGGVGLQRPAALGQRPSALDSADGGRAT